MALSGLEKSLRANPFSEAKIDLKTPSTLIIIVVVKSFQATFVFSSVNPFDLFDFF